MGRLFHKIGVMKKTVSLGIRLDEGLAGALEAVARESGIKPATLARMAIETFLREAKRSGRIIVPLSARAESRGGEGILLETQGREDAKVF